MVVDSTKKIRKIVTLDLEVAAKVDDFRFNERMKTEADALRALIEAGLKVLHKPKPKAK